MALNAECSQSNLFAVRDGAVLTPPLDAGLLEGVTRNLVFEVGADVGVPVREEVLRESDLPTVDELFITSTTREVVPAVRVGDRTIGSGTPGPVTSIFKIYGSELQQQHYELLTKMRGVRGFGMDAGAFTAAELEATRQWLFYRAGTIYSGSNEIQRNIIAKRVLGLPD